MNSLICYMQILYKYFYNGSIVFWEWLIKLTGG